MAGIPLSTIKTQIQTILETANTTTASPLDLSTSLTTRVQKILQINVEKIPIQPSFFPCITMFYEGKRVELKDIARDIITGRRQAEVDLKIIGIVWIDNMNTSNFQYKDLADNECEQLMENIEHVLRTDATLANYVLYGKTTDVSYHNFTFSEDAHMRAGVMNYQFKALY